MERFCGNDLVSEPDEKTIAAQQITKDSCRRTEALIPFQRTSLETKSLPPTATDMVRERVGDQVGLKRGLRLEEEAAVVEIVEFEFELERHLLDRVVETVTTNRLPLLHRAHFQTHQAQFVRYTVSRAA